jgi:hypothetical protein
MLQVFGCVAIPLKIVMHEGATPVLHYNVCTWTGAKRRKYNAWNLYNKSKLVGLYYVIRLMFVADFVVCRVMLW